MWHVVICALSGVMGLALGWFRGHCVGYVECRVDGTMESDALTEIDAQVRGR